MIKKVSFVSHSIMLIVFIIYFIISFYENIKFENIYKYNFIENIKTHAEDEEKINDLLTVLIKLKWL